MRASASQNQLDAGGSSSSNTEHTVLQKPLRVIGSLLTILAVATCLAVGTDCMYRTFQDDSGLQRNLTIDPTGFSASTFLTYVITSHTILYYPIYVLYMLAHSKHFKVWQTTRECLQVSISSLVIPSLSVSSEFRSSSRL